MKRVLIGLLLCNCAWGGYLVNWGDDACPEISDGNDFTAIATGIFHCLALRMDGSLYACGENLWGECDVPDGNFVAIGTGWTNSLAIREDGSLAAWGENDQGQCVVPDGNDYIFVTGGWDFSVAIKSDGSLVAWGLNLYGQCDVPDGTNFTSVACGQYHSIARRQDGTLAAWGANNYGECNVPGYNDFVAVGAGRRFSVAIRQSGELLGWGKDWQPECVDGNEPNSCPPMLYLAASGGDRYTAAIRDDGSIATWGVGTPPDGNNFVAISAVEDNILVLTSDETATLTIQTEPVGLSGVEPAGGTYYLGKAVYLRAGRGTNCPAVYDFSYWSGDIPDPCAASQYIIMDANKTITAHYSLDEAECGDECHPISEVYDRNRDCYVNLLDFAIFAGEWGCTHPDCD